MLKIIICIILTANMAYPIDIALNNRVPNREPGYCTWACLETLGKHYKIESLNNLVQNRASGKDIVALGTDGKYHTYPKNRGYESFVEIILRDLKIGYKIQLSGNRGIDILKNNAEKGCVVGIRIGPRELHSIIVTKYGKDKVEIYDPNFPKVNVILTNARFHEMWTGSVVVLD